MTRLGIRDTIHRTALNRRHLSLSNDERVYVARLRTIYNQIGEAEECTELPPDMLQLLTRACGVLPRWEVRRAALVGTAEGCTVGTAEGCTVGTAEGCLGGACGGLLGGDCGVRGVVVDRGARGVRREGYGLNE
jgi:hypothetical protein